MVILCSKRSEIFTKVVLSALRRNQWCVPNAKIHFAFFLRVISWMSKVLVPQSRKVLWGWLSELSNLQLWRYTTVLISNFPSCCLSRPCHGREMLRSWEHLLHLMRGCARGLIGNRILWIEEKDVVAAGGAVQQEEAPYFWSLPVELRVRSQKVQNTLHFKHTAHHINFLESLTTFGNSTLLQNIKQSRSFSAPESCKGWFHQRNKKDKMCYWINQV